MAGKLIALLAVIVSGCVPVIGMVYIPMNAADAVAINYGGCTLPSASFKRKIGDGVTLIVSITESDYKTPQLLIEGWVEVGKSARFLDSGVKVSSASSISYFKLLSSGLLDRPERFFLPGITGRTESIVVSLPPVMVNGTFVEIEPITFKPQQILGTRWICA